MINHDISRLIMTNHHPTGRGGAELVQAIGNTSLIIQFEFGIHLFVQNSCTVFDRLAQRRSEIMYVFRDRLQSSMSPAKWNSLQRGAWESKASFILFAFRGGRGVYSKLVMNFLLLATLNFMDGPLGESGERWQKYLRGQPGVRILCYGPPHIPLKMPRLWWNHTIESHWQGASLTLICVCGVHADPENFVRCVFGYYWNPRMNSLDIRSQL